MSSAFATYFCSSANSPERHSKSACSRRRAITITAGSVLATFLLNNESSSIAFGQASPPSSSEIVTSSGLRYYDFRSGTGNCVVEEGTRVSVHYTLGTSGARYGWRIASSREDLDGRPFTFTVGKNEVIRGLDEAVRGMCIGGKRRALVPKNIGYRNEKDRPLPKGFAEMQRFRNIFLNDRRAYTPDLILDVELVKVR